MPINIKYLEAIRENEFMHVIAKAVGLNVLFKNDGNKVYFLNQYFKYLSEYVDTYCFCLLDNHVHWLVKCKSQNDVLDNLNKLNLSDRKKHQQDFLEGKVNFERAVEYQWKDFFISYALSFNTKYNRKGTLFVNPFRRIAIQDEYHLLLLIVYIHANQIKETKLERAKLLAMFGGEEEFISLHHNTIEYYYVHPKSME